VARVFVKDTNPVAVVLPYAGSTAPTGWLLCDGSPVSRTVYASLFASIGTTYGSGDGLSTFNLPDMRGIFVRGAGSQTISGNTYSGTLGTKQTDQMQGHKHSITDPTHRHGAPGAQSVGGTGGFSRSSNPEYTLAFTDYQATGVTVQNPSTDGTNGTPRIGTQTQPANLALNYIIKA